MIMRNKLIYTRYSVPQRLHGTKQEGVALQYLDISTIPDLIQMSKFRYDIYMCRLSSI